MPEKASCTGCRQRGRQCRLIHDGNFWTGTGLWDPHSDSDLDRDATALLKKEIEKLIAFQNERNTSNVSEAVNSVLWLLSYIQFGINRWRSCCCCNLTFSVHWSFCRKKAWTATSVTLQRPSDWEAHSALPDRSWCITDAFSIITDSHYQKWYTTKRQHFMSWINVFLLQDVVLVI